MSLTVDLLHSMRSTDASQRRYAESIYASMCRPDRMRGLTSILLDDDYDDDDGRDAMAAVLLRREIVGSLDDATALLVMIEIAMPLLEHFRRGGLGGGGGRGGGEGRDEGVESKNARRQLGHCIAELCRAMSAISNPSGDDCGMGGYMIRVLADVGTGVSFL